MNKAEKVRELMLKCMFKQEEIVDDTPPDDAIIVEGIMGKFGFHPGRIEEHKEEIRELLNAMPEKFHVGGGGGASFLELCMDKDDEHWAEHPTMGSLICLGIAAKMAAYPMPREIWPSLPGGVPYVSFDTSV